MKKIAALIVVAVAMIIGAPATNAQFRWAATAGLDINTLHFKQDIVGVSKTLGYQAGIMGELMFPGVGFGVDFGLGYSQTGAKVNLGEKLIWSSQGYGNERVYMHNVHIPVHLRFKYTRLNGIENKIAPLAIVGPEFNIQVAHGNCDAFKYSGGDLGVTVGLGAELYKRVQVTGSYTFGATYALKTKLLQNYSAVCRTWSIRVAYFFK